MKKLKGTKIKDVQNLNTNTLYSVPNSMDIPFCEIQKDGTEDLVQLRFQIEDQEYGLYGNEYRPGFLDKSDCKAADILGLVVNNEMRKVTSYIYDVKRTVGGDEVIFHLVEQLTDSYLHKRTMLQYLTEYDETQHIGVITSKFDLDRIMASIQSTKQSIAKKDTKGLSPMIALKVENIKLKMKAQLHILERFFERKIMIENKEYELDILLMEPQNQNYILNLDIKL